MKFVFKLTIEVAASEAEARVYIHDAVRGWGGARHPDDPFFSLNREAIEVERFVSDYNRGRADGERSQTDFPRTEGS